MASIRSLETGPDSLAYWMERYLELAVTGLQQQYAPATVNNHLASLSGFTHWMQTHNPDSFPAGSPSRGIGELPLPPLEPRALTDDQVRSLKNLCDRLTRFHRLKGSAGEVVHTHARPWRDRAIVFFLLSTGLRREELVRLDLSQVEPHTPEALRRVRKVRVSQYGARVKPSGRSFCQPTPA